MQGAPIIPNVHAKYIGMHRPSKNRRTTMHARSRFLVALAAPLLGVITLLNASRVAAAPFAFDWANIDWANINATEAIAVGVFLLLAIALIARVVVRRRHRDDF